MEFPAPAAPSMACACWNGSRPSKEWKPTSFFRGPEKKLSFSRPERPLRISRIFQIFPILSGILEPASPAVLIPRTRWSSHPAPSTRCRPSLTGISSNLLVRAADVTLKERRKLILMVRESPFHLGHLRSMTALAEMGAIIAPPVPGFYHHPQTVMEIVDQSVDRVLDLIGAPDDRGPALGGPAMKPQPRSHRVSGSARRLQRRGQPQTRRGGCPRDSLRAL